MTWERGGVGAEEIRKGREAKQKGIIPSRFVQLFVRVCVRGRVCVCVCMCVRVLGWGSNMWEVDLDLSKSMLKHVL